MQNYMSSSIFLPPSNAEFLIVINWRRVGMLIVKTLNTHFNAIFCFLDVKVETV